MRSLPKILAAWLALLPVLLPAAAEAAALGKLSAAPGVQARVAPVLHLAASPNLPALLPLSVSLLAPSPLKIPQPLVAPAPTPAVIAAAGAPTAAEVVSALTLKPEVQVLREGKVDAALPLAKLFDGGSRSTVASDLTLGKASAGPAPLQSPGIVAPKSWLGRVAPARLAADLSETRLGLLVGALRSAVDRLLGRARFPKRSDESRHDRNRPTVVLTGPATPAALELLKEGARQSLGDVYLAVGGTESGHVKKALTADAQGRIALVEFASPRLIRHQARACDVAAGPKSVYGLLERARRQALKGRRILVIGGAAYPEKHTIFELMHELGVETVVVDSRTDKVKPFIKDSILVSLDDPKIAIPRAKEALAAYVKEHGAFDGITTFWEDEVPIAAEIAAALGLPYHSVDAATKARDKHKTREAMLAAGLATPHFELLNSAGDMERALSRGISYPMILKPAFGIEAMSVVKVESDAEARAAYAKIYKEIDPANDPIFNQGRGIVFEEYLDGDEVDVDLELQDGRVVFRSITDNWPTVEPYFIPKGSSLPSRLSEARQAGMIELAERTALALGFREGTLHIEGKFTSRGPRLLEVNARMGGLWVRDWVKTVWGVDLAEQQLLVAAGIPIAPYKSPVPLKHLEGEFFLPTVSGTFEGIEGADQLRSLPGFYRLLTFKEPGQSVLVPPQGYQRLGMLSAEGPTPESALSRFEALKRALRIKVRPSEPE